MMCSHRVIRAFDDGSHLKLAVQQLHFPDIIARKAIQIKNRAEAELDFTVNKRKTKQKLNRKKCISLLSDRVVRVKPITIGITLRS